MTTARQPAHIFVPAAIFAAAIFATAPLAAQNTAGLLGSRFFEISVFSENIREDGIDNGLGVGFRANIPLHAAIDLTLTGAQEDIDTNNFRERSAFATFVAHWNARDVTPYALAGAGNIWQSVSIEGENYSESEAVFAVGGGVEAPVGDRTAIDGRVTYYRYSSGDLGHYWIYGVSLSHWFTDRVAGTAAVNFRESDSTIFSAGLVLRF